MKIVNVDSIGTDQVLYRSTVGGWGVESCAVSYPVTEFGAQSLPPGGQWVVTQDEFVSLVVANHRSGLWLSCHLIVQHPEHGLVTIGVKAFGKWVQRMAGRGKPYWSGNQCTTVGAFKDAVRCGLDYIMQGVENG